MTLLWSGINLSYILNSSLPITAPSFSVQCITVEQGTSFQLDLELNACPYPHNTTWYFNQYPLVSTAEINLGANYIRIPCVALKHSGIYTVYSFNTAGQGSFSFRLNVTGMHTPILTMKHTCVAVCCMQI